MSPLALRKVDKIKHRNGVTLIDEDVTLSDRTFRLIVEEVTKFRLYEGLIFYKFTGEKIGQFQRSSWDNCFTAMMLFLKNEVILAEWVDGGKKR